MWYNEDRKLVKDPRSAGKGAFLMKRKRFMLLVSSLVLSVALVFSLCACAPASYTSPYEVATEQGYDGSEASWLASLYGGDGYGSFRAVYDEAVEAGYEGTFLDFISEYLTVAQDDSPAINRALMSVVSIWAIFSEPVMGGGWRPSVSYQSVSSGGSGVIYSLDKAAGNAYIVTNYHVVYDANSVGTETVSHISDDITVYLYGGEAATGEIKATYVGGAMDYDIAVLKVEGSEILKESSAREVTAANSDALTVGERVYAIGNPEGNGIALSSGVVSVDAEYITVESSDEQSYLELLEIRTDAPINHGNSGGGLFNADGQLIGIVNAKTEESGVEGVGFAIPSNLALSVAQNILDNQGSGSRGALRATLGIMTSVKDSKSVFDEATQKAYIEETVVVDSVSSGAASGILKAGDVLYSLTLDGQETVITRGFMVGNFLFRVRKGDTVTAKVWRDSQLLSLEIPFDSNSDFTLFD